MIDYEEKIDDITAAADRGIFICILIAAACITAFVFFDIGQQVQEAKNIKAEYCRSLGHSETYCGKE